MEIVIASVMLKSATVQLRMNCGISITDKRQRDPWLRHTPLHHRLRQFDRADVAAPRDVTVIRHTHSLRERRNHRVECCPGRSDT